LSQFPPAQGYPPPPPGFAPPKTGNASAVASLVLGVFGCLCITGILAIVFGILGLRRARDPGVGGKGMALGGIILGLVGLGFWIFVGSTVGLTWVNSQPQREIARTFIQHLSDSDIPAARSQAAYTLGQSRIENWSQRLSTMGKLQRVRFPGFRFETVNGVDQWVLRGQAVYTNGDVLFTLTTVKQDNGWRVYRLVLPKEVGVGARPEPSASQPIMPQTQRVGP
jgi:hypothetical protein